MESSLASVLHSAARNRIKGEPAGEMESAGLRGSPTKTATDFASVTRQGHQISPQTDLGQLLFVALSFYYVAAALPVYGTRPSTDGSVESLNVQAGGEGKTILSAYKQ